MRLPPLRPLPCAAAAAVFAAAVLAGAAQPDVPAQDAAKRLNQVLGLVLQHHVDSLSVDSVMTRAARGLVGELGDPYSTLYSPKELAAFDLSTRGRYGGVGMLLEQQEGTQVVARVYPNTPAERAGVKEGDMIREVGALATKGWPLTRVTDSLKGPEGTPVRVVFARPGEGAPRERSLTRAVVRLPAVPFAARLTSQVGYVPLQQFSDLAGDETRRAVRELLAAGAKGLVLDLRGNPGGLVDQAVDVAGIFLPQGAPVVQVRGREGVLETARTTTAPAIPADVPLVVLVDGGSASASEIVAGALQDHDRALVLGTRSFGKGLVQAVYPLEGGYALKMTTARWHTPLGRALHRARTHADSVAAAGVEKGAMATVRTGTGRTLAADGGITPDVTVRGDTTPLPGSRALQRAVGTKVETLARVLGEMTFAHQSEVDADGRVPAPWRAEFVERLRASGIAVSPAADSAGEALDRMLATRLLRRARGDSAVARRWFGDDRVLRDAVTRLERSASTVALLQAAPQGAPQTP
ncbi:S41 family peptidase [Roseisolibacter sp. H3M3-2]|uniref:S41 family peptidase n=1 Tax=Roseisolibacter sp. H3M3-2 TaxID=3031323 RepID=UPI0023DB90C8|nr:S41 family peptidase [Roseisolibacter sp. H3M3-2]MDF1503564.1 S41 family peptidase [Roseisolibacter sp. H3M3-2]